MIFNRSAKLSLKRSFIFLVFPLSLSVSGLLCREIIPFYFVVFCRNMVKQRKKCEAGKNFLPQKPQLSAEREKRKQKKRNSAKMFTIH